MKPKSTKGAGTIHVTLPSVGRQLKRAFVLALGWALIALGFAGLVLPVLQGVLLLLVGLYVLSRESEYAHRLLERLRAAHPHLDGALQTWKRRLKLHQDTDRQDEAE